MIKAAVADGKIDEATGYLYRFYAQWSDPRLPEAYQGASTEDKVVAELAERAFDEFTAEQQAAIRAFLVRPTHPESYFNTLDAPAAAVLGAGVQARLAVVSRDPACGDNDFHRVDMAAIPVTIWGRCLDLGGGSVAYTIADEVAELERFMTDLWPRMTGVMGVPFGDKFKDPNRRAPDEVEEAGDGRIDIYVVETPNTPYPRNLQNSAVATTRETAPKFDGTASGYIVYDPTKRATEARRKTNVAHEFFHVLQNRYNATSTFGCPYPAPDGRCTTQDKEHHWFVEASATWAEHFFVPEGRDPEVYDRFAGFLTADTSLSHTVGTNAYRSFVWPLFMQQESSRAEDVIGDVWKALRGKSNWGAIQSVVDQFMPFDAHFRDFAVRVWNEKLEPGDPIKRFQAIDRTFPTTRPDEADPTAPRFKEEVALVTSQNTYQFTEDLPDLWADYYNLSVSGDARRLRFNFGGLNPNASLDVDALVKVKDIGWQRRKLGSGEFEWCLDKPADAIQQIILVLSNHDLGPNKHVTGSWTVSPDANGCATATDTLVYSLTSETGTPADPLYQLTHETMTLRVSLASAPGGNEKYVPFDNDSSTYLATYDVQTVLTTDFSQCVTNVNGQKGGPIDGAGNVNAAMYEEDGGSWSMTVAASVEIPVTTTSGPCADSGTGTQIIQLPECVGKEIRDNDPGRIFNFRCELQNPGYSWSVIGKVAVHL